MQKRRNKRPCWNYKIISINNKSIEVSDLLTCEFCIKVSK